MKTFLLVICVFMFSGFCDVELKVKKLKGSVDYPYQYTFVQEVVCTSEEKSSEPKYFKSEVTLSTKHDGKIGLDIPTYKIKRRRESKGAYAPTFTSDNGNITLKGNIYSLVGNSNEKGVITIGENSLTVNIKGRDPFISGRWVDKLGSFDIYRSIDMRENLEDGSSDPTIINQNVNGHTTTSIYLKSIKLDKAQRNSFFYLSDKVVIFLDEERKKRVFTGTYTDLLQEGKLLSVYFDNNVMKRNLFGTIHSTLLNKPIFIDIGTSQATINGTYTFD